MHSQLKQSSLALILLITTGVLAGCSNFQAKLNELNQFSNISSINNDHPLIQHDLSVLYATVYFIRPKTEHPQGYADAPLQVDVDGEKLMMLGKAEYTMLYVKPRDVTVTMSNKTQTRGRWEIEKLSYTRRFSFEPGETYYILAKPVDGEFRGAHFIPTALTLIEAKKASRHLSPIARARKHQIINI